MNLKTASWREGELMLRCRGYLSRLWLLRATVCGETMERGCRGLSGDEGQSLVEFALIFAALFAMLFGIFELCLASYTYHYVSESAREGTRYAVVRGSSCALMPDCNAAAAQIQTYVQGLGYPGINPTNMTVTTNWLSPSPGPPNPTWSACTVAPCNAPGNLVQVQVNYAFPLGIPFWGSRTINISSTSQMVISQ